MDELDLFRDFRSGVRGPGADAERRASGRLAQAIDRRPRATAHLLGVVRQRRKGLALAPAVLAATAAVALFLTAPWSSTPGFLEKADAALTPPVGSILHFKVILTVTSKELDCTAARPTEVWIDQTPPHRYRALIPEPPPEPAPVTPGFFVCWKADTQTEIGSQTQPAEPGLVFVPPNTLRSPGSSGLRAIFPSDPVQDLRQAISDGRAHDEGKTTLDGRTVERIRIDPAERTVQTTPIECLGSVCIRGRLRPPVYAYVDPKTFALVQERVTEQILAGPLKHAVLVDYVERYLTFEYLPRTPANLALTNIRAQHPDATVKCVRTWQYRC
jgi:hypothetical protein